MYGPTGQSFERACTMTVALLGAAALRMPVETMGQQRNSGVARPLLPGGSDALDRFGFIDAGRAGVRW